jgi:hypothetical protein
MRSEHVVNSIFKLLTRPGIGERYLHIMTVQGRRTNRRRHEVLFRAFVGIGQMVSQRETDRIFYEDTLAWARETGNTGLVDRLTEIGPPPYEDVLGYESALSYEQDMYPYDHTGNSEGEGGVL